jgi:hypothetical protein
MGGAVVLVVAEVLDGREVEEEEEEDKEAEVEEERVVMEEDDVLVFACGLEAAVDVGAKVDTPALCSLDNRRAGVYLCWRVGEHSAEKVGNVNNQ